MGMQAGSLCLKPFVKNLTGIFVKVQDDHHLYQNQLRLKIGIMFGNPEITSGWVSLSNLMHQSVWMCERLKR